MSLCTNEGLSIESYDLPVWISKRQVAPKIINLINEISPRVCSNSFCLFTEHEVFRIFPGLESTPVGKRLWAETTQSIRINAIVKR